MNYDLGTKMYYVDYEHNLGKGVLKSIRTTTYKSFDCFRHRPKFIKYKEYCLNGNWVESDKCFIFKEEAQAHIVGCIRADLAHLNKKLGAINE